MRRRDFVAGVGCTVLAPLAARAQQQSRLPIIGFLGAGTPEGWAGWVKAFQQRLRENNWTDGRNVAIEYRWAEGRAERIPEIVQEFVRLKVDVIVGVGGNLAAIQQAPATMPIVLAIVADPVGTGIVASLARPGGNITGLSLQSTDLAGKRLQILHEAVPQLRQLAVIANTSLPATALEVGELRALTRSLGIDIMLLAIAQAADIPRAFDLLKDKVQALYVPAEPLVNTNRFRINELAREQRLPTMFGFREYVESGGLLSYGPNTQDLFRRSADYVDKILRGAKPADLPVEQPTKFDLVINLATARTIGLTIPPTLLARADEVIE